MKIFWNVVNVIWICLCVKLLISLISLSWLKILDLKQEYLELKVTSRELDALIAQTSLSKSELRKLKLEAIKKVFLESKTRNRKKKDLR